MANLAPAYRFFILLGISCSVSSSNVSMKNFISYPACSSDMVLDSDILESTTATSLLDCSSKCATREDCLAVNVCKTKTHLRHCDLLGVRNNGCSGLVSRPDCKYKEKDPKDHNPCHNGGTYVYAHPCECPPGWAGYYCERLVRDCQEAKISGLPMDALSLIQPINCPYSFKVFCNPSGYTYFLRRNDPFQNNPDECIGKVLDPDMDWNGYRSQFGSSDCDYMVGLDQLWYILQQGSYNLHLYFHYHANPSDGWTTVQMYYWNFQMATEAEGFAIQYTGVKSMNPELDVKDGLMLGANTPTKFCTHDRDCGTCAKDRGVAWWYTPNCDNHPLTVQNGTVSWPINGTQRLLSLAVMQFFPNAYYP